MDDMESDEDLYIKMNSRGKPLTPFENFKARFEQDIQHSDRGDEFAHKIDGAWSDLLWPFHGGDNNERADEHLDFLFSAFDKLQNAEYIRKTFNDVLSMSLPGRDGYDWRKVVLFGATSTNLFRQCLRHYGDSAFTLQQSLLLYAFLLHLTAGTDDFPADCVF